MPELADITAAVGAAFQSSTLTKCHKSKYYKLCVRTKLTNIEVFVGYVVICFMTQGSDVVGYNLQVASTERHESSSL
jgi:hypothetical protein